MIVFILLLSLPSLALAQPDKKDQKKAEAKQIKSQVEQIDQDLDCAVEQYNQANCRLGQIKTESIANSAKLKKAEEDLQTQKHILSNRLRNIYKHGNVPFIETILSTRSFEEFLCTLSHLQEIASEDANIVRSIEELKKNVEKRKLQLAEQQKSQEAICRELVFNKAEIDRKLRERKNTLAGVEEEVAALEAQEQAEAQRLRARVEAQQEQAARRVATSPQVSRGSERVPAPKGGAVAVAMQQLGKPYRWGGAGPDSFDCSGLVMYCYAQIGVSLPHSAAAQYGCGTHISRDQLQPGDLVFFSKGGGISHVGMYVGGDSYIHAPHTGDVVKISSLSARGSGYVGACRP